MQSLLISLLLSTTILVATDGQYYYSQDDVPFNDYPVPVDPEYYGYPISRAVYPPNYVQPETDAVGPMYDDSQDEYQIRVKPIKLHIAPYTRQGRGKKGGGGGKKGGGGHGGGGWWYYRDHKGCHSGTYGPPPPPGLEKEHYIQGACGKLGNHFKRVQGKKPGHGPAAHHGPGHHGHHPHGPPKKFGGPAGHGHGGHNNLGWGQQKYGQGWGWRGEGGSGGQGGGFGGGGLFG